MRIAAALLDIRPVCILDELADLVHELRCLKLLLARDITWSWISSLESRKTLANTAAWSPHGPWRWHPPTCPTTRRSAESPSPTTHVSKRRFLEIFSVQRGKLRQWLWKSVSADTRHCATLRSLARTESKVEDSKYAFLSQQRGKSNTTSHQFRLYCERIVHDLRGSTFGPTPQCKGRSA